MTERDIFLKNILPLWQDFLTIWYHHLTRIIRPRVFYSYLRDKKVFNINDEELVEKTYITTAMKAGLLIDTIVRKGESGFIAFMEVIEYSYPDLFWTLTNLKPRHPPDSYMAIIRTSNTNNLLECLSQLQESLQEKKDNLEDLRHNIRIMKEEFDNREIKLSEEVDMLRRENDKLRGELALFEKRKDIYDGALKEFNSKMSMANDIIAKFESLTIQEFKSIRQRNSETLNGRLCVLEEQLRCWHEDRMRLESTVDQLKTERDEFKKLSENLQMSYERERSMNKKLEEECQECVKKHDTVVVIMDQLKLEIMEQKKSNFVLNHHSDKLRERTNKLSSDEHEGKRRFAAVFQATPPLIVYPPKDIRKEVTKLLEKHFGKTPEDLLQSKDKVVELVNGMEILRYEKTYQGFRCILNSKLKQMEKTALLEIPVTFIPYLIRASISPTVVVVKLKDGGVPINEEKYLKEGGFNYHEIEVDAHLKNDALNLVERILPELKSLTGKW